VRPFERFSCVLSAQDHNSCCCPTSMRVSKRICPPGDCAIPHESRSDSTTASIVWAFSPLFLQRIGSRASPARNNFHRRPESGRKPSEPGLLVDDVAEFPRTSFGAPGGAKPRIGLVLRRVGQNVIRPILFCARLPEEGLTGKRIMRLTDGGKTNRQIVIKNSVVVANHRAPGFWFSSATFFLFDCNRRPDNFDEIHLRVFSI